MRRARGVGTIVAIGLACSLLAGCAKSGPVGSSSASPGTPTATAAVSPSAAGALIAALPSGCDGVPAVPTSSVVSFMAGARVWSVAPDSAAGLHCLFSQDTSQIFSWGPQGDRVLLDGLQVRGVNTTNARPVGTFRPTYYTWSRPTGTTVWFTDQNRTHIYRADMGTGVARDITPLPGVHYGDMAYHPSGLAVGFVATDQVGTGLWISTNLGANPRLLVRATPGTNFGHIVFSHDGVGLYYSVDSAGGGHSVAYYDMISDTPATNLWVGTVPVGADIYEMSGAGVGLTIGATCAQHQAVYSPLDGSAGVVLAPSLPGPTTLVGRADAQRFIVAAGGCGTPEDLYVVSVSPGPVRVAGTPALLVASVTNAGVRLPEPTPPPPLPSSLPRSGFA